MNGRPTARPRTRLRVRQGRTNVVFFLFGKEESRDRCRLPYMAWSCIPLEVACFLRSESAAELRGSVSREGNLYIFCFVPTATCGVMRVAEQRVTVE